MELFFMLSGLTFTAFYMKRIANNEVSASDFIYSRFTRLVPLHWGSLFLVTFLLFIRRCFDIPAFVYGFNDVHHFTLNLLMIHSDGLQTDAGFNAVSWTICTEVVMYVVFFCLCRKIKTKHAYLVCCWLLILLGYSLEKSSWSGTAFTLVNTSIGRGMIDFFFGSMLYFILLKLWKLGTKAKITAFALLCIILGVGYYGGREVWSHGDWWYMLTGFVFFIYPLAIYLTTSVGFLRKILMWTPLQYLGKLSFTIYMCHYPVQLVLDLINKAAKINASYTSDTVWMIYCLTVIGFSVIIHRFYEVPITNWLKKAKNRFWTEEKLAELQEMGG